MSGPHTDNNEYPSIAEASPEETFGAATVRTFRRVIAGRSVEQPNPHQDCTKLLQMIGLIPSPPPVHPQRRKQ